MEYRFKTGDEIWYKGYGPGRGYGLITGAYQSNIVGEEEQEIYCITFPDVPTEVRLHYLMHRSNKPSFVAYNAMIHERRKLMTTAVPKPSAKTKATKKIAFQKAPAKASGNVPEGYIPLFKAKLLGVSYPKLRGLVKSGKLTSRIVNRNIFVIESEVLALTK